MIAFKNLDTVPWIQSFSNAVWSMQRTIAARNKWLLIWRYFLFVIEHGDLQFQKSAKWWPLWNCTDGGSQICIENVRRRVRVGKVFTLYVKLGWGVRHNVTFSETMISRNYFITIKTFLNDFHKHRIKWLNEFSIKFF